MKSHMASTQSLAQDLLAQSDLSHSSTFMEVSASDTQQQLRDIHSLHEQCIHLWGCASFPLPCFLHARYTNISLIPPQISPFGDALFPGGPCCKASPAGTFHCWVLGKARCLVLGLFCWCWPHSGTAPVEAPVPQHQGGGLKSQPNKKKKKSEPHKFSQEEEMRLKMWHTDLILQPAPSEVPTSLSSGLGTVQPQGASPLSMTHAPFANPHLCPQPAESAQLLSLNCTNQEIPGHDECHTASSSYLTAAVKQKCWISSCQLEEINYFSVPYATF